MPKVFIINKSPHDFSDAKSYGELTFLSEGRVNRYQTNIIFRDFYEQLKDSNPDDYLLITSLNTMNIIATTIMVKLHDRINILIHNARTGRYVARTLNYKDI